MVKHERDNHNAMPDQAGKQPQAAPEVRIAANTISQATALMFVGLGIIEHPKRAQLIFIEKSWRPLP